MFPRCSGLHTSGAETRFCELGRVIRTGFLLRYISDAELRSTIQGATNKSEALNRFLKWTVFGGEGVIQENSRDEQRKAIKYNHLVANCLIFHNLCSLTRLVQTLEQRGETVSEDATAAISPYLTEHINRFGDYTLNLGRKPPPARLLLHPRPHSLNRVRTKWPTLERIVARPQEAPAWLSRPRRATQGSLRWHGERCANPPSR